MRNNQPITQQEKEFSADTRLVSMTDLQGDITFVNLDFLRISGFNEQELLGSHHNIVRLLYFALPLIDIPGLSPAMPWC